MSRRRRLYHYEIGVRKEAPFDYHAAKLKELLRKHGHKPKIKRVSLCGVSRIAVDAGYHMYETLDSIAGHSYGQLFTIEFYAFPEQIDFIEIIIRGLYMDILKPNEEKDDEN